MTYPWGDTRRFNSYAGYFRRLFGCRVQKLSVDAGFTCPNRDGTIGEGGCTFCNNGAFTPSYCMPSKSVGQQIAEGIEFHRNRYRSAQRYLVYFQAFSNTYAPLERLKRLYDEALAHPGVAGSVVGTRPDCVDERKLDYFAGLARDRYVALEYGIESTCDETAAALVEDGRHLLSNVISTSVKEQALYGGVVPEIASRRHCEFISATVKKALLDAGKTIDDVDAVAVTFAPGLIGAVLVGVNFAKGLAYSAGKPLVPVHHLRGHIAALYLTHPELKPPFLCLVASGGHSHIVEVQDYTHYHILGHTVDDAAGEAFDKVARTLGLPYPGGPSVANAAKTGDPKAYRLPVPHVDGKYNVSFSGLKTAVLNEVNQAQMKGTDINVPDLAASFQERIAGILAEKLLLAAADTGAKQVCLAGGVAANGRLRQLVNDGAQKLGAKVYLPELKFCGDNGAMIAAQGYYQYMAGHTAGLDLNGLPTLPIDYE